MTNQLLEPIRIGNVKIRNRMAMSPMNMTFSTHDGYATDQNVAWHARRAKGGFGLIISDAIIVTRLAAPHVWGRNLYLYNDSFTPELSRVIEGVHKFQAKIFAQLSIGFGRQGHAHDGTPPYAPSPIPMNIPLEMVVKSMRSFAENPAFKHKMVGETPRVMTIEEIRSEEIEYGKACERAVMTGFDGIEIHAPHGYLEHQFLSPLSNKREDEYGGSLENRMRFIVEVTEKAIEAVRGAIPVGIRMSAAEHLPGGFTIEDIKKVVKKLEDMGIAYFNMSDGSYEALKYFFPESVEQVENHLLKEAKEFKELLDIPIIMPSLHDPICAERAIADGIIDIASLGRQAIADPDWPNKVMEGRINEIVRCKRCQQCVSRGYIGHYPRCMVNPEAGYEKYDLDLFPQKRTDALIPKGFARWYTSFLPKK